MGRGGENGTMEGKIGYEVGENGAFGVETAKLGGKWDFGWKCSIWEENGTIGGK